MKFTTLQAVLGSTAALVLSLPACAASSAHRHLHPYPRRPSTVHRHSARAGSHVVKRGKCAFPTNDGNLVAVTPDAQNAGWAMSPDQPCTPDKYCPYACKPGMVMAQWDPDSSYTYPASMNGGLYCDANGDIKKPFPDKPLCVQGTGAVKVVNQLGSQQSWCQTVLPGNEAMLIPTVVSSVVTLAVPDTSYWQGTAAHYYINPPGSDASDCVWGEASRPVGNWSPFVAGANTDANGNTFVKLGLNPIWEGSDLYSNKPSFGVKIECPSGNCQGLPCAIAPGTAEVSNGGTVGAGGAPFCVATVPKGASANIVVYSDDGSGSGSPSSSATASAILSAAAVSQQPEKTSAPPTSSATSTTASEPSSTTPSSSSTSSSSTVPTDALSSSSSSSSSSFSSSTADATSTTAARATSSHAARPTVKPGIFHENSTSYTMTLTAHLASTHTAAAPKATNQAETVRQSGGGAFAGLIVAFIAAAYLF